ncbi:HAD-IIIC family phosphatase [Pseudaquabacterium pictum]|uniref:HAD-IIIC family phosphatase n=1 Tax=Pseudaquabacterium pictum TaxID=2315236 RepID=A0A480AX17_9BURK|nr:HAD-IIIC family phosphatase [Rubrivivax pictus]GCL65931.1 hypothetical protein AQPW35_50120 [Rubrivivax pictus]
MSDTLQAQRPATDTPADTLASTPAAPDWLALLRSPGTPLARTLAALQALEPQLPADRLLRLGLSANVSIDLLGTQLRRQGVLCGTRVVVQTGQHDDPVGDAERFLAAGLHGMVWVQLFDNLLPALELQLPLLPAAQVDALEADLRARWRLVFSRTAALRHLHVTTLHRLGEGVDGGSPDLVDTVLARFNAALRDEAAGHAHVRLVDSSAILRQLGAGACLDMRFYLRHTAPYTARFAEGLAERISLATRGFHSRFHKALVLDCDNTLWGGIVGEDGPQGIQLDPHSHPGRVYWRAQLAFAALEQQGVLLCLCSKNNPADVEEVLARHPHAVLRPALITQSQVNWDDKVRNLRAIATNLGIGLDSLVFVDDSPFECEAVRQALPEVTVLQVPATLSDYPQLLQQVQALFLAGGVTADSRAKTAQYRQRQAAAEASAGFATHEDYLASLDLRVRLTRNDSASIARISELSLKSNQFNLTTLRQTPAEIQQRMQDGTGAVYSLHVTDRFGDAGLTGVVLVRRDGPILVVDAFLMSCRVIGRGIEFAIWPQLLADARAQGCTAIAAHWQRSAKNAQVEDFYDRLGLPLVAAQADTRHYAAPLDSVQLRSIPWITLSP